MRHALYRNGIVAYPGITVYPTAVLLVEILRLKPLFGIVGFTGGDLRFFNHGVHSIKDLYEFDDTQLTSKLTLKQFDIWMRARDSLLHEDYSEIVENLWLGIEEEAKQPWTTAGIFILSLCVALFTGMVLTMSQPRLEAGYGNQKLGFLSYVTGRYLSPLKCKVVFDWTEPQVVGNTMSFTVKVYNFV
ncbi:uncharacterized protein TNCV_1306221 [Trichonephila clavipes]|nr:uncharacterized protein TNCV_1306221 [Trichonephila clavipes]